MISKKIVKKVLRSRNSGIIILRARNIAQGE